MGRLWILGWISLASACSTAPAPKPPEDLRPRESLFRVGDWVEYQYSGSYRKEPVTLLERVIDKEGALLTIQVQWRSGKGRRSWVQRVTDTPENRAANRVDELIEIVGGQQVPLENPGNRDLFRLYEGTYVLPEGPQEDVKTETVKVAVCGRQLSARRSQGKQRVRGKDLRFEMLESPEFPWYTVGVRFFDGDQILYELKTVNCGNKPIRGAGRG